MKIFEKKDLKKLFVPKDDSLGEDNGQVVIIGGSGLFHGAPILSLKVASRICDMVFFASPSRYLENVSNKIKSSLMSFIWVPWGDVEEYIKKADAILIGPGMMRYKSEKGSKKHDFINLDRSGRLTKNVTKKLLNKYRDKKWVIDAGSLQVINPDWIPENAIITPNKKEFEILFKDISGKSLKDRVLEAAKRYKCTIVLKGSETIVCNGGKCVLVKGGNPGLTKGGTGDVLSGLSVSFLAKNPPFLAAASSSYIEKMTADILYEEVGLNYNADDLADRIPEVFKKLIS